MASFKDLTGQRFGRLTVMKKAVVANQDRVYWECLCDCGKTCVVQARQLTIGKTKSCGCLQNEKRHSIRKDLTGQKFGRLTALFVCDRKPREKVRWHCICECGTEVDVLGTCLISGYTRSCGCLAKEVRRQTGEQSRGRKSVRFEDLTGQRFGRLVVLNRAENSKSGRTQWRCLCDCGKERIVMAAHLKRGHSKSCGCLGLQHATEAKIKHGGARTNLYQIYRSMKNRCELETCKEFKWYGAKGIKVCDEWSDYTAFSKWANENGYQKGLTIDRKNPLGNYEPSNCEWITRSENSKRMHQAHGHQIKEKN